MLVQDLGRMGYREAWAAQEDAHAQVLEGGEERVIFVEHPPVITFGRREGGEKHLIASAEQLAAAGVDLVHSDRGGDITFHGPGQVVAYPIIRLNDHGLSVGGYVHGLESVVIATLADLGIPAQTDPGAVGVWTGACDRTAKVCAIGVRIRRGISLHGLALNLDTDLRYFNLIVPCGLASRPVTSLRELLGEKTPDASTVKSLIASHLQRLLIERPAARQRA